MLQVLLVLCWALLVPVGADECPDGGSCEVGHTCCSHPASGYDCCPFDQAECCGDHMHCCPAETICDSATSSCVNGTVSIPWVERAPADQPRLSKSFRMIKTYVGEEDDNVCPDQSRCPPEFSCLRALNKFGCCPLAQGVPCSDGKHCCPEDHQCSADGRSCIKQEFVKTVLCSDGVSECPDGTTCCINPEGKWGCCPLSEAVCCEDKMHCCPEGTKCDVEHSKCIQTSTGKEMPMWAKLPARIRAEWENQKEGDQVTAETVDDGSSEKVPEVTTADPVPPSERETLSVAEAAAGDVPCSDKVACPDNSTCCKNSKGGWNCCPFPEAVCCDDFLHCCPHGMRCNLAAMTCDDNTRSVPLVKKTPAVPRQGVQAGNVSCDSSFTCPDGSTCCKNKDGKWACCPLPEAVCCDDHEHCCPTGTTCDLATLECNGGSGSTPMLKKMPACAREAGAVEGAAEPEEDKGPEEENEETEGRIQCDPHTSCPQSATCCFMKSSKKWGCCPVPEAVCCADGNHCCPTDYKCDEHETTCVKGEVVIPWYTKLPATSSVRADPSAVQCDDQTQCPESTTCCQLATGKWGCCPLQSAVCCQDKQHCCPEGYTCDITAGSCQKLVTLQLETVPLTPVYLPGHQPRLRDVKCDDQTSCPDGQTCCRMSETTWGCCPYPDAVCCSDLLHCCPSGYTCTEEGQCMQKPSAHWYSWHVFLANRRRAQIV